jgi:GTP-binding protein Era
MIEFLPEGEPYYPTDEYTEHPVRFLAGEMVREVATKLLKQELPYSLAVEVEEFKEALSCHPERAPLRGASEGSPERKCENEILRPFRAQNDTKIITRIRANIIVEKESQKAIVIGRGGEMIKKIGTLSREKIEAFVGTKVFLGLQVKVEKDWTKDEKALKRIFNK